MNEDQKLDTSIIYDYQDYPDKESGRCDNCGSTHFNSSVKNYQFLRKCSNCGLTKSI
ncbi:hypothetical protein LS684_06975 [Cytobacillus spongiae]|uniref:hypothetical protein n=1 Tax=Cytobacillus spongiae TaxID=2901381 RepID=UPI001F25C5D5|nr:hypothetical protein [Cytobacillus spongiae]UII57177.1 hypothetical protein LS684_06975 [Cytobacillus spongiae]